MEWLRGMIELFLHDFAPHILWFNRPRILPATACSRKRQPRIMYEHIALWIRKM